VCVCVYTHTYYMRILVRTRCVLMVLSMCVQACVNAALTLHGNPLLGSGPKKKPPKVSLSLYVCVCVCVCIYIYVLYINTQIYIYRYIDI
jgi:hypothetical protein